MATLPDPLPRLHSLGLDLPPGELVGSDGPLLWLGSDRPVPGAFAKLRAVSRPVGLLPVLLDLDARHGALEHWESAPDEMSYPGDHDPEEVLADFWDECCAEEGGDWPGLAAPAPPAGNSDPGSSPVGNSDADDPDAVAERVADELLSAGGALKEPRLALVPARRSADIPAALGWLGAVNHADDAGRLGAVLRSWEDRFGIRLVALGFDELVVSVAVPPVTGAEARAVAAEHFAFCPDNLWQGSTPTLDAYAERHVRAQPAWHFWWD
ncbi:DUF4253 domain-containing protein [Streptomyces sp. NPDC090106]|uniref:DUF4253 domain-containing protein n=1 Tax=Streptomyces sp. NPDC090106 TaxID=3365946 RepID=UPI00380523FD